VGDYRALVGVLDAQPKLCERVVAALGLQKGWAESRQHALSSVDPDFFVRWVGGWVCGLAGQWWGLRAAELGRLGMGRGMVA